MNPNPKHVLYELSLYYIILNFWYIFSSCKDG